MSIEMSIAKKKKVLWRWRKIKSVHTNSYIIWKTISMPHKRYNMNDIWHNVRFKGLFNATTCLWFNSKRAHLINTHFSFKCSGFFFSYSMSKQMIISYIYIYHLMSMYLLRDKSFFLLHILKSKRDRHRKIVYTKIVYSIARRSNFWSLSLWKWLIFCFFYSFHFI